MNSNNRFEADVVSQRWRFAVLVVPRAAEAGRYKNEGPFQQNELW